MMEKWITTLLAGALVCALVLALLENGTLKALVKLICGVFLTFCILQPVSSFTLEDVSIPETVEQEAEEAIRKGRAYAKDSAAQIIAQATAAYIQDKARALGAQVEAEVILSDEEIPVPIAVLLNGELTYSQRQALEAYITQELGIGEIG